MNYCSVCGDSEADVDLRPYGKRGAPICWECSIHPDHEEQSALSFALQLLACGDEAFLSVHGPVPPPGPRWN